MNFKDYIIIVEIAKECHLKNNELMIMNGEEPLNNNWDELDNHTKYMGIKSVLKVLDNPDITAKDIHDEWMKNKIKDGWSYGETKDQEKKTHPLIIEFDLMNDIDKLKDQSFIDICNKYREFYTLGEVNEHF